MKKLVKSKIVRPQNTKEKGIIEFLVYKEKDTFVGICLTFDIIEEGKDAIKLMSSITTSANLHLDTVIKNKMSDELLNRYAPEKYWKKYFKVTSDIKFQSKKNINNYPVVSPYTNTSFRSLKLS